MTLAAVRKALSGIVRGTTGLSTSRGLPPTFSPAHETGDRDRPGDARRFYFVVDAMAGRGPYTPGAVSNRRVDTMRLVVSYPADVDDAALEDAISSDYDKLTARLLDSALWADTPIVDITAYGPAILPAAIESDGSGVTLTLTMTVEHIR